MSSILTHGQIVGGVVATPNLSAALADYHSCLGLEIIEQGPMPEALAESWACPGLAGASMATLQPKSGAPCFIRLVEQPLPAEFRPTTTFGWGAYEINVQDVFGWPGRLAGSGFEVVGSPKEIASMPFFVPMQVTGRGKEMLYLNEVRQDMPSVDLPRAGSPVDRIFICILGSPDRAASVAWYRDRIGLNAGDTFTIEYTMINKAFALPPGTQSALTMVQKGRMPILEIDDYPPQATARPVAPGMLPPGNALVSLAVDSLDAIEAEFIALPRVLDGPVYAGRRAATAIGAAGERVELIEVS